MSGNVWLLRGEKRTQDHLFSYFILFYFLEKINRVGPWRYYDDAFGHAEWAAH